LVIPGQTGDDHQVDSNRPGNAGRPASRGADLRQAQDRVFNSYVYNQSIITGPTSGHNIQQGFVFNTQSRRSHDEGYTGTGTSTRYNSSGQNMGYINGTTSGRNIQVGNSTNSRSRRRDDRDGSTGPRYNTSSHNAYHSTGTISGRNIQQGIIINKTSARRAQQSVFVGTRTSGRNVQQGIIIDTGTEHTRDDTPGFSPRQAQDRVDGHHTHNVSVINGGISGGRNFQLGNIINTRSRGRREWDDSD